MFRGLVLFPPASFPQWLGGQDEAVGARSAVPGVPAPTATKTGTEDCAVPGSGVRDGLARRAAASSASVFSSFAYASRLRPRGVPRPDSHARTVSRVTPTRAAS